MIEESDIKKVISEVKVNDFSINHQREWLDKLHPYKRLSPKRSTWQVFNTFIPFFVLWYISYRLLEYSYPLSLTISLINAGFMARMFLILHDCCHRSFYSSKKLRDTLGFICGVLTLTPFIHWRKIHLTHHACSSNLGKRDIGDFPLMTVEEYLNADEKTKKNYRFMRHFFTVVFIVPFVLFFILQRFPVKNIGNFSKKDGNSVTQTNLAILGVILLMSYLIGFKNFFLVQFPTSLMVSTIGVWMFFVQHQFEDTYWTKKEDYDFYQAGMKGSSYLDFPKIIKWFTADVSYHHIHHLAPEIPNYNLRKCHNAHAEFQKVPTLGLFKALGSTKYKLWDEKNNKLITLKELNAQLLGSLKKDA